MKKIKMKLKGLVGKVLFINKLSLAKKMGLFVATLTTLALGTIFFAQKMNQDLSSMVDSSSSAFKSSVNANYLADATRLIAQLKGRSNTYILAAKSGEPFDVDEFGFDVDELNDVVLSILGESEGMNLLEEAKTVEKSWDEIKPIADKGLEALDSGELGVIATDLGVVVTKMDEFYEVISKVKEINARVAQESYKKTFVVKGKTIYNIYAISAGILVLAVIGIIFFLKLAKNLKDMTEEISKATVYLVSESEKLAGASGDLTENINSQQDSINQSVSAIDEITAMNKKTMEVSQATNESGKYCKEVGDQGKQQFSQVLKAIERN